MVFAYVLELITAAAVVISITTAAAQQKKNDDDAAAIVATEETVIAHSSFSSLKVITLYTMTNYKNVLHELLKVSRKIRPIF